MTEWIDAARAREICAGDGKLYLSLVRLFLESYEEMYQDILRSFDRNDTFEIEDSIHKIKGACRNLAATPAVTLLQAAEDQARLGHRDLAKKNWEEARRVLESTVSYLSDMKESPF